jgi:hypothetical protein
MALPLFGTLVSIAARLESPRIGCKTNPALERKFLISGGLECAQNAAIEGTKSEVDVETTPARRAG